MMKKFSKIISKFDNISKEVKLNSFVTNETRYQTAFGGFLSIITLSLCCALSVYMLSALFYKSNPKAYEVTKFVDDTPKIIFDNQNNFFVLRFYTPFAKTINESFIKFYGVMYSVKNGTGYGEYGFDPCIYDKDFNGVEKYFPSNLKEDLESNYFCLSKMFLNGSYTIFLN